MAADQALRTVLREAFNEPGTPPYPPRRGEGREGCHPARQLGKPFQPFAALTRCYPRAHTVGMPPRLPPAKAPDPLYARLGERVLSARRHRGMSQQQLAERVGLTRTSITNLERGHQKIQVHTLYAVAEALGVDPATLLPQLRGAAGALHEHLSEPLHPEELDWVRRVVAPREQ